MSELSSLSVGPLPSPERPTPGIVVVAPLTEENRDKSDTLAAKANKILGYKLYVPHQDFTLARVLPMHNKLSEEDFAQLISDSQAALDKALRQQGDIVVTVDTVQASKDAVIAKATGNVQPVADLRRLIERSLSQVTGAVPTVKRYDFLHTTIGRPGLNEKEISQRDIARITLELRNFGGLAPMVQSLGEIVAMIEIKKYELRTTLEPQNVQSPNK